MPKPTGKNYIDQTLNVIWKSTCRSYARTPFRQPVMQAKYCLDGAAKDSAHLLIRQIKLNGSILRQAHENQSEIEVVWGRKKQYSIEIHIAMGVRQARTF